MDDTRTSPSPKPECSIDGCTKKPMARGWCTTHYSRWKRQGDPLAVTRATPLAPGAEDKYCARCKNTKPLSEFKKRKSGAYAGWCTPCAATYQAEHAASEDGREMRRKARSGWNTRNHEYFLRYRYGITLADYEALVAAQSGRCAICGTDEPGGTFTKWAVDHCHDSSKVRGLLCGSCNMGIGQFGDDPARLRAAADYLERSR